MTVAVESGKKGCLASPLNHNQTELSENADKNKAQESEQHASGVSLYAWTPLECVCRSCWRFGGIIVHHCCMNGSAGEAACLDRSPCRNRRLRIFACQIFESMTRHIFWHLTRRAVGHRCIRCCVGRQQLFTHEQIHY
jgi:hypothetical protein